ncbi:CD63 antigen-like [Cylas formicarius]|uniref:CD63 antigen-like n=1 Tax=Cylas formicarius TaxID=197179 RepID=UPI0029585EC3|nr:CD63 antigen-like [Cylas formicarius]
MIEYKAFLRNYSRYLMIIFNLFFVVTGIIIISVGISAKAYYNEFDHLLNNNYFYVSDLLIVIGIIIFFIAFFGCYGAMKENACMTTTFSTLLIVIFIMEAVVGFGSILLKSKTEDFIAHSLDETLNFYNNSNYTEVTATWDAVQSQLKCCGVMNYTDWVNSNSTNKKIPISCCSIPTGSTDIFKCQNNSPNLYKEGCLEKFGDYIRDNTSSIEIVGITLALIQLLGIILSCYLSRQIRNDYETV